MPPSKRNPPGAGGLRGDDRFGKRDPREDTVANNHPQGAVLVLRHLGHGRYAVERDGEDIVPNSSDPERSAARALLHRGITGGAVTVDAITGTARMRFDITAFAQTCVEETSHRGVRVRKWRGDRVQKASSSGGVSTKEAVSDAAAAGEPPDQERAPANDVQEAA